MSPLDVCRFCLSSSRVEHHIFDTGRLFSKITACLPLKVSEADGLPQKICAPCSDRIDDIFEYINTAKCAERELIERRFNFERLTLDGIRHEIKDEPEDEYGFRRPEEFSHREPVVSQYTQTEFAESKDAPSEREPVKDESSTEKFNWEYRSVDVDQYSSEDDKVLSDVIKIPSIKLKPKTELHREIFSLTEKKIKKRKREVECVPKKTRGRPKGSSNRKMNEGKKKSKKFEEAEEDCDAIVKKEHYADEGNEDNFNLNGEKKDVSSVDDGKLWQCLTCLKHVDSRSELLQHYKDHVENPSSLEGSDDTAKFTVKQEENCEPENMDMKEKNPNFIIVKSNNSVEFQCRKCYKPFVNKRALFRHLISHDETRPFICNLCGRAYKRAYEILLHGRAHSGVKTLFCRYELCNYSTVYRGALLSHHKRHEPDFKYTCEVCNKGFDVLTWFTEHKNVHTGAKPFSCDICGKNFIYSRYLASHRKTVHPETNVRQLVHRCDKCNLEFPYRKKLQRHIANAHSGEYALQVLCDICGKRLSSREHLKFHRRIHTGEKPHVCRTCGKGFVKKCNLTLHERIHSGERPHVCSHCGKAFSQRSTLVIHERYHSGARPYQCEHCKKGFVAKGLLSMHQKTCS